MKCFRALETDFAFWSLYFGIIYDKPSWRVTEYWSGIQRSSWLSCKIYYIFLQVEAPVFVLFRSIGPLSWTPNLKNQSKQKPSLWRKMLWRCRVVLKKSITHPFSRLFKNFAMLETSDCDPWVSKCLEATNLPIKCEISFFSLDGSAWFNFKLLLIYDVYSIPIEIPMKCWCTQQENLSKKYY